MATSINYNLSRFWVPSPRGFLFGDRVLRFGVSASPLVPAAVEALTSTLLKPGKTTAASILNRVLWADDGTDDMLTVSFGEFADPVTGSIGTDDTLLDPFDKFMDDMNIKPPPTGFFDWGPGVPSALVVPSGDNLPLLLGKDVATGQLLSRMMSIWPGATPSSYSGPDYDGVWRVGATMAEASILEQAGTYVDFSAATMGIADGTRMSHRVLASGRNVRLLAPPDGWAPISNVPDAMLNPKGEWLTVKCFGSEVQEWGGNLFEISTSAGEHPIGDRVRDIFGISAPAQIPGNWTMPRIGTPFRISAGVVHGIHRLVQSMAFGSDNNVKYMFSSLTRTDMLNMLEGQKVGQTVAIIAQIDAVKKQIGAISSSMGFNHLMSPTPIGPYDIYQSKTVLDAIANGADMSDIDSTMVGGTSMADWRVKCNGMAASSAWLWCEQTNGSNLFSLGIVLPSPTAPFWTGYVQQGDVILSSDTTIAVDDVAITAVAAQRGQGQEDALQFLGELLGHPVEPLSTFSVSLNTITKAANCPWLDLPGAWMKRCMSQSMQALATGIAGIITEPASLFTQNT